MFLSVVIAYYNGNKYLNEQLDSIRKQTYPVNEIVIINDCSDESPEEILSQFEQNSDIKIVYKKNTINRGYADTFFKAMQLAKGDIIFIADQDDRWHSKKVEIMSKYLTNNKQISCLSSLCNIVDGAGNLVFSEKRYGNTNLYKVDVNEIINQKCLRVGMSLAVSRLLIDELSEQSLFEYKSHDYPLEFISSHSGGFYILNEVLVDYRIHGKNTSGLNLSYRLRSDRNGRIAQINKEISFLELFKKEKNVKDKYTIDLLNEQIRFYQKRRDLLCKGLLTYVIGSMIIFSYYTNIRIWVGDVISFMNFDFLYEKK